MKIIKDYLVDNGMDKVDKKTRSIMMAHVKSKNTTLEVLVRKRLFSYGFRYRLHLNSLPGNPDIILPKYNTAIFINGCFWHLHGCRYSTLPETRRDWWQNKLNANKIRDSKNYDTLKKYNWRIAIIWECSVRGFKKIVRNERLDFVNRLLMIFLVGNEKFITIDSTGIHKTDVYIRN